MVSILEQLSLSCDDLDRHSEHISGSQSELSTFGGSSSLKIEYNFFLVGRYVLLDILFGQFSTFLKDSTTFVYGLGAL